MPVGLTDLAATSGVIPPVEASRRSTPCSESIPANLTVSSRVQDGSFVGASPAQSVADILSVIFSVLKKN